MCVTLPNPRTHMLCSEPLWHALEKQPLHAHKSYCLLLPKVQLCCLQKIAQDLYKLLRTVADMLRQWSAESSRWVQQQTLASSRQPPAEVLKAADQLHDTCHWLLLMAKDVAHTFWRQELFRFVDQPLLLDTLGQLVWRVRSALMPQKLSRICCCPVVQQCRDLRLPTGSLP
jgi:hypothetical protein